MRRHVVSAGLICLLGTVWFILWTAFRPGPVAIGYVFMPLSMAVGGLAAHSLRRRMTPAPAGRRFWLLLEICCYLFAAGFGVLLADAVRTAPELPAMPPLGAGLIGAGVLVAMWGVAQVPVGVSSWYERGKQWLDRTIAFLGCSTVLWHFGISPMFWAPDPWTPSALVVLLLACLFAAGAITKVSYIAGGPVDRRAMRLVASTGLMAAGVALLAVLGGYHGILPGQAVCMPVCGLLIALGARRQLAADGAPARTGGGSVWLPYLAVLAVDVPVADVLIRPWHWAPGVWEGRVVVLAAVVVTALVALRQFVVHRENARLLREKQESEALLRHEATHDPLTGLANRALFRYALDRALETGPATVLLADLDEFKTVNDSLGHDAGDGLLMAFARVLRDAAGDGAEVARLAGDEFAVLVPPGVMGEEVARRIADATAAPISEQRLLVKFSAGLATAPPNTSVSDVLRQADAALYAAKERGRANWVRYAWGMERPASAHARLGGDLRRALDAGEFRIVYQPIVSLGDGEIVGVEALVRWEHPERGLVSPADFIPAAERTGLIVPLGRWVLRETCRQAAAWIAEFGPDVLDKAAPNVSVRQLHDPDFVADVAAALADSGLPANRLVLELTESAVLRGQHVSQVLHELHDMGVRLALDDFGTGESSLSLLRAFPAAIVKLDKSFVDGIELDEPDTPAADARQAVARAVAQLADALGLDTVAEGIESQEQADRLLRLGYHVGQGYHLGRPMPPGQLTELLAARRVKAAA
ncbi:diguanylate cyclase (GGDEF) domain-containing protein [Actinoplanes philippinensis]|uniref:Diguanylate cyclase (GGDEF) domain-containing protein n=1 Tax=Actinoplanes philippinensis TaxID=35752 RepID=A0A1I2DBK6_9ACTN|nr:bifunctional diguanylate cyclase/phosphodiesterase [Actinoplanes philippinensis]SFE77801.1 diguanylate cyclase (GGDEF) domain-containing protein [Actinoplanes philippinensis]